MAKMKILKETAIGTQLSGAPMTGGQLRDMMGATGLSRQPSAADRNPVKYNRRRRITETSLAIAVPAVLVSLWQIGSTNGWWDRSLFPAPSDVWTTLVEMFRERDLLRDILATLSRIMWGYAWGCGLGLTFGFVMGLSRTIRRAFEPMFNALYTVPKIALLPVFLIVFGFGEKPVIVLIAVTVFFFAWIPTQAAVMSVPASFREASDSFGANKWQLFRHVILPASLPTMFVTLRVAASVCVLTIIGVEFVYTPSGNRGLGFVINTARQNFTPRIAYAGILVAAAMGVVFASLVRLLGRLLVPWEREDNATSGR